MRIAFAESEDLDYLAREDHHVQRGVIEQKIERREIVVLYHDGWRAGALRYGYFWDEIPFMNLLWGQEELRGEDSVPGSWRSGKTRCERRATKRL
jgi:hypothetical protein